MAFYTWYYQLYRFLAVFSGALVGLTAARLNYTNHLSPGDPLNSGQSFLDPIVIELFIAATLGLTWAFFMVHALPRVETQGNFLVLLLWGLGHLCVLWVLYIVGAAYSTHLWGNLSFCWQYDACKLLTALVAFAWIGWITVSSLLFTGFIVFLEYC